MNNKRVYIMDCGGFIKIGISNNVDKRKNQIKKEKPSKLHITFIDKIPPFLPLATIIDIKSYKKTSLYNSFSDNDFDKSSNQKSSKNKCCLLI